MGVTFSFTPHIKQPLAGHPQAERMGLEPVPKGSPLGRKDTFGLRLPSFLCSLLRALAQAPVFEG